MCGQLLQSHQAVFNPKEITFRKKFGIDILADNKIPDPFFIKIGDELVTISPGTFQRKEQGLAYGIYPTTVQKQVLNICIFS